jgi:hypothetical protein
MVEPENIYSGHSNSHLGGRSVRPHCNLDGCGIFAAFIISYLLLASVVVLFATYWHIGRGPRPFRD